MGLGVQEVHGRAKERLVGCECPCVLPRPLIAAVDVFRCEWRDQFGPEINLKSLFHILWNFCLFTLDEIPWFFSLSSFYSSFSIDPRFSLSLHSFFTLFLFSLTFQSDGKDRSTFARLLRNSIPHSSPLPPLFFTRPLFQFHLDKIAGLSVCSSSSSSCRPLHHSLIISKKIFMTKFLIGFFSVKILSKSVVFDQVD